MPEAQGLLLSNTLTPTLEVQRKDDSVPNNGRVTPWADRSVNAILDYEETLVWPDEEEGELSSSSTKLFSVSENTSKLLQESFLKGSPKPVSEADEREVQDPRCPPTRVPKFDKMVKDRIVQESVKLDRSLARLQVLFLDAVGPMATILKEGEKGSLTMEKAMTAARMAL